jgi:very-short-patch-repair endonuclease
MHVQLSTQLPDQVIRRLATRQNGVVARRQLLPLGITRDQVATRLRQGRLIELHRGVYLVGAVPSEHALAQAALLALKGEASLCCFTAAHIWKARSYSPGAYPWVTVPADRRIERPRIHVLRADLAAGDIRTRYGMRLTSPPRTVLDCAALIVDDYEYEALVGEMKYRGLAHEAELAEQVRRNPRKRGVPRLRRILALPDGPRRTRSKGERAFLRLLREEGISGYETNSKAFGPELDFVWADLRFAVEVDGWDGHSGRVAFERDRLKIAGLQARGVEVMPVTGRQIRDDRRAVARRLKAALAHRAT